MMIATKVKARVDAKNENGIMANKLGFMKDSGRKSRKFCVQILTLSQLLISNDDDSITHLLNCSKNKTIKSYKVIKS